MKTVFLLLIVVTFAVLSGCSSGDGMEPVVLVAKWKLVSDSTAMSSTGMETSTASYKGTVADYFDFRSDGKCYIKEGNVYDTLDYHLKGPTRIVISNFGDNDDDHPSVIDPFTGNRAVITSPLSFSSGGFSYRTVTLKK
ncbi:MAG TPA: hypothetical protein VHA56_00690 [Mucilaginibacter sp.]|nr:hypothetical protein [Mucilaginibacter sp.]